MSLYSSGIIQLATSLIYILLIVMVARQDLSAKVNRLFILYAFLLMMWSFVRVIASL